MHLNHKTSRVSCFGYLLSLWPEHCFVWVYILSHVVVISRVSLWSMIIIHWVNQVYCYWLFMAHLLFVSVLYDIRISSVPVGLPSERRFISKGGGHGDVMTVFNCGCSRVEFHGSALVFSSKIFFKWWKEYNLEFWKKGENMFRCHVHNNFPTGQFQKRSGSKAMLGWGATIRALRLIPDMF